jgi:hypothetical protein
MEQASNRMMSDTVNFVTIVMLQYEPGEGRDFDHVVEGLAFQKIRSLTSVVQPLSGSARGENPTKTIFMALRAGAENRGIPSDGA